MDPVAINKVHQLIVVLCCAGFVCSSENDPDIISTQDGLINGGNQLNKLNISVVGNGYVGLTTAVGLACTGHRVLCIDRDITKVDLINQGESPIYEEGLRDILRDFVKQDGNLRASLDHQEILDTDITIICVGTSCNSDGNIDLSCIETSVRDTASVLATKDNYHVVIIKSTVTPGTTEHFIIPLLEKTTGKKVGQELGVVVNPEFLQEGKALRCFLNPDRIVIGESDQTAGNAVEAIYKDFAAPILRTDLTTAEMIKFASNAFLATKISFINEVGNICQKFGVDVYTVAKGMSYDPRIGNRFLEAGTGFGGSCLPKDLRAFIRASKDMRYYPQLLESVLAVNKAQAMRMVEIAERKLGSLQNKKVAVLGVAFKPNTDDVREAPALEVMHALLEKGALVKAYDPIAMPNAKRELSNGMKYCDSASEAISDSDCILILTEWDEFKCEESYRGKLVIDGRRVLNPQKARAICDYQGICW